MKELRSEADAEIKRLSTALEAAKDELDTLQTRAGKGNPAAEDQIEDQRETCRELRGTLNEQSTHRGAIADVLRQKPDPKAEDGDNWETQRRKPYGV